MPLAAGAKVATKAKVSGERARAKVATKAKAKVTGAPSLVPTAKAGGKAGAHRQGRWQRGVHRKEVPTTEEVPTAKA